MSNVNIQNKLDFWVKSNLNVLFIGKHGVGKTAMVKQAFDRCNLNWRYFSASTMDPWVDFVGVPKEKSEGKFNSEQFEIIRELGILDQSLALEWIEKNWHMNNGAAEKIVNHVINKKQLNYLELVRPRTFATGEVEALFFDEFNRSPKKVRNAVMELLQFKSINGEKFPNLKIVWAAINPEDDQQETYDVEKLDPAQKDRFHVVQEIPYRPNVEWFREKFGRRYADAAIGWWNELDDEFKNLISPRRLEYALNVYGLHGDIRDVIPKEAGVSKLSSMLNTGPTHEKLSALMEANDVAGARVYLSNENQFASAMKFIPESETLMQFFVPLIPKEKMASTMADNAKIRKHIISNSDKIPVYMHVCDEILKANTDKKTSGEIRKTLQQNAKMAEAFATKIPNAGVSGIEEVWLPVHYNVTPHDDYSTLLRAMKTLPTDTLAEQTIVYGKVVAHVPKDMTADQALTTLEVLNVSVGKLWPSSLSAPAFEKLVGVVNHCIKEINRNTGYNWQTILHKYGGRFVLLMTNLEKAGLTPKIVQPRSPLDKPK